MKFYTITFHVNDGSDQDHVIEAENLQEAQKLANFMSSSISYVDGFSIQPGKKS